jgi:hypothetical protein
MIFKRGVKTIKSLLKLVSVEQEIEDHAKKNKNSLVIMDDMASTLKNLDLQKTPYLVLENY